MIIDKNKIKQENLKNKNVINEKKNENSNSISVIIRRKGNIENKYTFEPLNTIEFLIETVRKKESNVKNTVEIYYNNILITDYLGTLQDYKIENNSIIDFYDYTIGGQYFVKTVKGKTIAIDLEPSDTIKILKEKINYREAIPLDKIKIIYQGKLLEDDKTIKYYNLKEQIYLTLKIN